MSVAANAFMAPIAQLIETELAPQVQAIDREGRYPAQFMHKLGALGGFGAALPAESGGKGLGLAAQIEVTAKVAEHCGSTAFLVWCQSSCAWYFQNSENQAARERYLRDVTQGRLLAGTGMSNAVKHLAGIEKIHLRGRREGDGYVVNGSLPWVSNVGEGHLAVAAAEIKGEGYIMFATPSNTPGFDSRPCLEFAGLEGTQTLNLRYQNVKVPPENVLAHPEQFKAYVSRIKPGFVLGQVGMGTGIVRACIAMATASNASVGHVNMFLDDQDHELQAELQKIEASVAALAPLAQAGATDMLPILKTRAAISELTLKAANSAVLHTGAKGYLMIHPAQRRLREAVFVAIVTPALKHLRKEIHALEQHAGDQAGQQAQTAAA